MIIVNREIDRLEKWEVLKVIKLYDNYIKYNSNHNEEFGHSWFPVTFEEFYENEYKHLYD